MANKLVAVLDALGNGTLAIGYNIITFTNLPEVY